jgi:putative DNA primase/helicase
MPRVNAELSALIAGSVNPTTKHKSPDEPIEVSLVLGNMEDVIAEKTEWLWEQKLPLNVLIGYWGNPGCGKTTHGIFVIACVSTGRNWPDGTPNPLPPSHVLLMAAEDDYASTIKPRLIAAEADMSKVRYLKNVEIKQGARKADRHFALDTDISALRAALIAHPEIKLVVIDPVTRYLGSKSMNKEQEVSAVLTPLRDLCLELKITILVLGHFNKRGDVDAMQRVAGAMAWIGLPRASWGFGQDPDVPSEYLMTMLKVNSARDKSGMRYAIAEKSTPVGGQPVIEWKGRSEKTADDMTARKDPQTKQSDKALAFLKAFLEGGDWRVCSEIQMRGEEQGISWSTIERAKRALNVEWNKGKNGVNAWRLVPSASADVPASAPAKPF